MELASNETFTSPNVKFTGENPSSKVFRKRDAAHMDVKHKKNVSVIPLPQKAFKESELNTLPSVYKEALERAYHRAQTRQNLHKYDIANQDSRFKRQVGYGLMKKMNGFDDVKAIKSLDEYRKEREFAVEQALLLSSRKLRPRLMIINGTT